MLDTCIDAKQSFGKSSVIRWY